MTWHPKQLSNPFSTGGGGGHFEAHIQASFVALMLTGGFAPCLPCWPIREIKLQGKIDGFETDDLIVFIEDPVTNERRKLLCQIKHSIAVTAGSTIFAEVIHAAWSDFNNPQIFKKGKDAIALITGPLSAVDFQNVRWLLEQARHTKDPEEFFRNVEQAHFSPSQSGAKLAVIRQHLKVANDDVDVSDDELYDFLFHFHLLGYDLGREIGVVMSLIHSHISQFNSQHPPWIWSRIVDNVQSWNQNAGSITSSRLPEDLVEAFRHRIVNSIPTELVTEHFATSPSNWNAHPRANELALTNLIGSWSEENSHDISLLNELLDAPYSSWILSLREILQNPESPISLRDGHWKVNEREELWDTLSTRIFDQHLEKIQSIAIKALREIDPAFDLPVNDRHTARLDRRVFTYSLSIRKGLADSLAALGSRGDTLVNCTQGKAEATAALAIRKIFSSADWKLWGSLNDLLPTLAEAAPEEFLNIVDDALRASPCPFDELFEQEGKGIFGRNYLTGLLWALEGLAWEEKYLVRTCVLLSELAVRDPGGQWSNRPINSLTTILLPWLPQTTASINKRKVAIETLYAENPSIGWSLIIQLLPNHHQTSTESHKPKWRRYLPEDWKKGANSKEYWEQVSTYAEIAISRAGNDPTKLAELIDNFDNLPKPSFDNLLTKLVSTELRQLPEEQRRILWNHLTSFISKHRKYPDANWTLSGSLLSQIETAAGALAPISPLFLYQHLFANRDFDLYEEGNDWEEQHKILNGKRQDAIRAIASADGIEEVIKFAELVESPEQVGLALGGIAEATVDTTILPRYLVQDNRKQRNFSEGFILGRFQSKSWNWIDGLDRTGWTSRQVAQFLCALPFNRECWNRVASWMGEKEVEYWSSVNVFPYQTVTDLDFAAEKLLQFKRPIAAIRCIAKAHMTKVDVSPSQCVQILLAAVSSKETPSNLDSHLIIELIKFLQKSPETAPEELFSVEWAYLPLLDRHRDASPMLLEGRLTTDPNFFCEVIRLIYKSKKVDTESTEVTDEVKAIATNAWRLLHEWRTPPGLQADGEFNPSAFQVWLNQVKTVCEDSGHLAVALTNIGEVLIHVPADNDGLWINRTVAAALNDKDADSLRKGFRTGCFNSRGVHWVDPTGKPELELSEKYKKQAEDVENAGFHRLAETLRGLASTYQAEAARVQRNSQSSE